MAEDNPKIVQENGEEKCELNHLTLCIVKSLFENLDLNCVEKSILPVD